ncbi:MAG: NAD-dependent epimerase/dehydratase family protein [Planctomycetaceae bacterium]
MSATAPSAGPVRPTRLVVGTGPLGARVAAAWRAAGDRVFGTTRRPARAAELAAAGIEPVIADVAGAEPWWRELPPLATVFWAVGFDRAAGGTHRDVHVTGLGRLLDGLAASARGATAPRVIFSSSTGVWGDEAGGIVDESTPPRPGREAGRVLVEAEEALRAHPLGPGVALRFAGLYGPGRLPRLDDLRAGRPLAADPDSWLNLLHLDDAARVVRAVAAAAAPRPLYVVSDGRPVRRCDWYGRLAALVGAPPPTWDTTAPRERGADKRVSPALLFGDLGFTPLHPDSLATLADLVPG